ncbi:hypothetical protein CBER1_02786 [Cercospora berteroae]|uniref:BTB domain-containing protein n=1 Tax=Cercospora berteroae TaxID=357750 RepID=A0A2S6CBX5_9PEZI|nr:hypothetical protein CBER1_02786 [Cercospora berteroae]
MARDKTFSNTYLSADYTDLEIHCDGAIFFAHRAATCARSKVLEAECKAGLTAEGKTIFEHQIFNADTIDCLLQYIYTDDYSLPKSNSEAASGTEAPASPEEDENDMHQLAAHVYVHAAADLYDIAPLKALTAAKFVSATKPVKENERMDFLDLVARIAKHTMPSEQNVLRTKVLQMALQQKKLLLQDRTFVELLFERNDLDDFVPLFVCGTVAGYEEAVSKMRAEYKTDMHSRKLELESVQTAREEAAHARDIALTEATTLRTDRDETRQKLSSKERELEMVRRTREQAIQDRDAARAEVTRLRTDLDGVRQRQEKDSSQLKDARSLLSSATARERRLQEMLDRRVQIFNRIRCCRHCDEEPFRYTLDEEHNARCRECNTRHYAQRT